MGSIYMITNTVNGKAYIGKSINDAKKKRVQKHFTGYGNKLIKQAIAKYGVDIFTVEILHDGIIPELLDSYEIEAIAKYNTIAPNGYNLTTGGGGKSGYKHSEETRRKIGDSQRGEKHYLYGKPFPEDAKRKMSESKKGKKLSAAHRQKMSESQKGEKNGFYGKKHTPESRQKMSNSLKGMMVGEKNPNYGKTASPETRKKLSDAHKHPNRDDAHRLYVSLPKTMSLAEKRKILRDTFPIVHKATVWLWVHNWSREDSEAN